MKKHTMIPTGNLLRSTINVLLFTLLAAGMAACNGSNASDSSQSPSSQPASSQTASDTSHTPASDSAPAQGDQQADQQADRQQKREAMRKQIETVLTSDQAKQLETKLQQGEKMRQALSELNLTAEQKTKIQAIRKAAYSQQGKPSPDSPK